MKTLIVSAVVAVVLFTLYKKRSRWREESSGDGGRDPSPPTQQK
jgi:hypothetical protein